MTRLWARLKPALPLVLAAAGWVLFFTLSMLCSRAVQTLYPGVSLRYSQPLSNDAAVTARRFSAAGGSNAWPTFWREDAAELSGGVGRENCTVIWYSGDAHRVWPATFLAGSYPAELDEGSLAVSTQTAWALWGSFDVLGFEATLDGKPCRVSGVFEGNAPMALVSLGEAPFARGWTAAELDGTLRDDVHKLAEDYAQQPGLGAPGTVLNGPAIAALCTMASLLPAILLLLACCARFLRWLFGRWPKCRAGVIFGLLLGAALLLPTLLDHLPPVLVPNRWSDFSFWQRLGQQIADGFTGFMKLHPYEIDLRAKMNLLALLLCSLAALFFGIVLVALTRRKEERLNQRVPPYQNKRAVRVYAKHQLGAKTSNPALKP